jgi:hypothetical protein
MFEAALFEAAEVAFDGVTFGADLGVECGWSSAL